MIAAAGERLVPLPVALRLFVSGAANQWTWIGLGLGLMFFWLAIGNVDWSGVYYLGQVERARGVITDSQETNLTINDRVVMANSYRFTTPDGAVIEDFSYATGTWHADGATVTIEYPAGKPHLSRIQGMRRQKLSPLAGSLFALFPLAVVLFAGWRIRKGLRYHALLKRGRVAHSQLVEKTPTNMRINDQPVYKLTFQFTAEDGKDYQVTVKSHNTEALEDDDEERLLYDPSQPENATMVDTLPGQPRLNEHGSIRPQPAPTWACLIPALTLFGHGAYLIQSLVLAVL